MPEVVNNIKTIIENNRVSGVSPMDILNPNTQWTDSKMSDDRLAICRSCPDLIKLTKQCKKCGCFMGIKAKIEKASCPIGKW